MVISHPPQDGRALWVSAHPRSASLTGELRAAGTRVLADRYQVATSDLYAQGFDPVLDEKDLGVRAGEAGTVARQLGASYDAGTLRPDVRAEQEKIAAAELLVLQFPLWWYGPPAILKGWIDRVFVENFAYGDMDPELGVPRRYGDAGLSGRRALVIVSAGDDPGSLGPRGISGDIDSLLFPLLHGALWYVGIETLELHVIHDADHLDAAGRAAEVARLENRLVGIDTETPIGFRRLADGEYSAGRALAPELAAGRTDLGIHRG